VLCRALWSGKPVDWDGRWQMSGVTLGPAPYAKGSPPLWMGGCSTGSMQRAARTFDGWFSDPREATTYGEGWVEVQHMAAKAGRDPSEITAAMYLTLWIDDEAAVVDAHMAAFFDSYYSGRSPQMAQTKPRFAGSAAGAADYLASFAEAGTNHFVLRFTGNHEHSLKPRPRSERNWDGSRRCARQPHNPEPVWVCWPVSIVGTPVRQTVARQIPAATLHGSVGRHWARR
jgi:alkanesulfonate monooxygenase SsuD/methylene tetrahydromethanopterin reductase-like flavin-dependent oxidoreductase (luciferase family)